MSSHDVSIVRSSDANTHAPQVVRAELRDRGARTRLRLGAIAFGLLALGACGSERATQILVEIDAAEDVKARASFVRVRVEAASAGGDFAPVSELGDVTIPVTATEWPRVHVLAPLDGDTSRIYRVTARALDGDFRTVSEARRQSGYVARETRVLQLFLPGGACLEVTCPDDRTCEQGLCLEVPMIPPELLPRPGDALDGGSDAGDEDGGVDGGTCDPSAITCEPEGECETAEVSCETGEPVCVRTPREATFVCRAAAGECDAEETCDGLSPVCPADAAVPFGTECATGFCFGQICGSCSPGGACDTGNPCEIGEIQCGEDGTPTCMPMRAADPGTVCRAAVGSCDVPETCQDTTCPADARVPAGELCRSAMDACDEAELCNGTSPLCPTDAFRTATTVCRASQGACDPAETCTGSGPTCPGDVISPMGTVCRSAGDNLCDVSEVCNGTAAACPADGFAPFGSACGINPAFVCDGAGNCAETNCGAPCDTGRPCEEGVIECRGDGETVCVVKGPRASGTVCRASNGPCDVQEVCNGASLDCPADGFATASTVCRTAAGPCDAPESCSGTSPTCPTDQLRPSSHVCRAALPGSCDRPESCSGSSVQCPNDAFQPSGTICRAVDGACDVPEVCSGMSATCPSDQLRAAGEVCRIPTHPSCDVRETCTGTSRTCPADEGSDPGDSCRNRPSGYGGVCAEPMTTSGGDTWRCLDLVIGEIRLGASGYIELYNRFCQPLRIDDCVLMIQGGADERTQTVELEGNIASGGFHLVGMGVGSPDTDAGVTLGTTLAAGTSLKVELFCHGNQLDLVEAATESSPGVVACNGFFGPMIGFTRSLERKATSSATATSMQAGGTHELAGNAFRTGNPVMDFVCQPGSLPQSTRSATEPMGCRL